MCYKKYRLFPLLILGFCDSVDKVRERHFFRNETFNEVVYYRIFILIGLLIIKSY